LACLPGQRLDGFTCVLNGTDIHLQGIYDGSVRPVDLIRYAGSGFSLIASIWHPHGEEQALMRHQLILVMGLVMGTCLSGKAQTPAKQIVLAQELPNPMMLFFRSSPSNHSSPNVFLPINLPPKQLGRYSRVSTATYEPEHSLESRFSIVVDQNPFITKSSMAVAELWGGRLELVGFGSKPGTQYVQFGPSGISHDFRPPSYDQKGVDRSADLYGISLRVDFRKAQTGRPTLIWRCLGWIVGKGRSCPL
jgi:hypothetical protein